MVIPPHISENQLGDGLLRLARNTPSVQDPLAEVVTAERRLLLGSERLSGFPAGFSELSLVKQLRISRAWMAQGENLDQAVAAGLEKRAKMEADDALWVDATRVHVLSSNQRELQARIRLSQQDLPFVLPGEISDLQVDLLASGDRALHVLHVEWLKKLAELAFDTLPLDCRHQGFWFLPFLEVLPEKKFLRRIKRLARNKRLIGGGLGVAAFYNALLGGRPEDLLKNGNEIDSLVFNIARRCYQFHAN